MESTQKTKKPMGKDEVALLLDLLQCRPILTSKETNAATNKLKEEAWGSLTLDFNAKNGNIPRQREQLKAKWDNLKKSARKRWQEISLNDLKTGGGNPDIIPNNEILERVASMLGLTCAGFEVPFGGDEKRRKYDDIHPKTKYGLGSVSKELRNSKEKKKKIEDVARRERNLAIAKYYEAKTIKTNLEIELLKKKLNCLHNPESKYDTE